MNGNKQKTYEKHRLERKKLLAQLEQEINELNKTIEDSDKINYRKNLIRISKIFLRFLQRIAPYVVASSISFAVFTTMGSTPFIRDDEKCYLKEKKEMDSRGNVRIESQYEEFENSIGSISYYSNWEKDDEGFYKREEKKFLFYEINPEALDKIENGNIDISLEEILGTPSSSKIVKQNNLTEEEINEKAYVEAIIYSKNKDEYIIVKESIGNNIAVSIAYLIVTALFELVVFYIRDKSKYDYKKIIENINEKYKSIDTEQLIKKLEIKKQNYDRLRG